jgi:hypothetical protein
VVAEPEAGLSRPAPESAEAMTAWGAAAVAGRRTRYRCRPWRAWSSNSSMHQVWPVLRRNETPPGSQSAGGLLFRGLADHALKTHIRATATSGMAHTQTLAAWAKRIRSYWSVPREEGDR